jgi:organic hydroperoxide reductase OsmC/OhrA
VRGTLDRRDGVTAFVDFEAKAVLVVAPAVDAAQAEAALQRAERGCLVSNSLKAPVHLTAVIEHR